jgi:tetratricopeptide (TPR) repeat protein
MSNSVESALQDARRERAEGRTSEAEQAYNRAAELARSFEDSAGLAHALRHISDLERARGASEQARQHASEAVELYRSGEDRLGLANAIRSQALSAASTDEAQSCWREARELYASLGITAGVTECDFRLSD